MSIGVILLNQLRILDNIFLFTSNFFFHLLCILSTMLFLGVLSSLHEGAQHRVLCGLPHNLVFLRRKSQSYPATEDWKTAIILNTLFLFSMKVNLLNSLLIN